MTFPLLCGVVRSSTMKRVIMMLLVLLAMSVQAGIDHKKKGATKKNLQKHKVHEKKLQAKIKSVAVYKPPTPEEQKKIKQALKDKKAGNKCVWKATNNAKGEGEVELNTKNDAKTRLFEKHNMIFQHLIGTSNNDGLGRSCIMWVGENLELFKLKDGKIPIGPQEDAESKKFGQPPRMWRYSNTYKGWMPNHVAAHVEIQTRENGNGEWESQGNWLIPTSKSSNSRAGKKCDKTGKNLNDWETLRGGVESVTAIELPSKGNSC